MRHASLLSGFQQLALQDVYEVIYPERGCNADSNVALSPAGEKYTLQAFCLCFLHCLKVSWVIISDEYLAGSSFYSMQNA